MQCICYLSAVLEFGGKLNVEKNLYWDISWIIFKEFGIGYASNSVNLLIVSL